jgi:hypothetical protein
VAILTNVATIEEVLLRHAAQLGADAEGYRNHVMRVFNLCVRLSARTPEALEKIAIAAVFHDLGIWTAGTFDYLEPSIDLARAHLAGHGLDDLTEEVSAMIRQHHKVTAYRAHPEWLVEDFRRADWIDVTRGLRRFGQPRIGLRPIFARWPSAGFHARLALLTFRRLRTHPREPLPMFRL